MSGSSGRNGGTGNPSPFEGFASALEQSWSAPLRMWSAFANAWQSALQNRGIPAYHTAVKQMTGAAGWTSGLNPFMDEMLEVFDLPKLADIPAFEPGVLPSLAPAAELAMVTQQYMFAAFGVGRPQRSCFNEESEKIV